MPKFLDLTGHTFERLTVLSLDLSTPRNTREALWLCQCLCGNRVSVRSYQLRRGRTRSCGCLRAEQLPANLLDLTGETFERLTVIERDISPKHPEQGASWICQCICGKRISVLAKSLRAKKTRSCGCLLTEAILATKTKHGATRKGHTTPEYKAWQKIKERCLHPKSKDYPRYGGRGISICQRWQDSFMAFLEDMGGRPGNTYSIERRDNDGPYTRENCYWATRKAQARNTRNNVFLTWNNETHCISEWSEILQIPERRIAERYRAHWPVERILTEPPRRWPSQR